MVQEFHFLRNTFEMIPLTSDDAYDRPRPKNKQLTPRIAIDTFKTHIQHIIIWR
jgi:hypothetical protein